MNKEEIYSLLIDKTLGYLDLIEVPLKPVNEELVSISSNLNLSARQIDPDMFLYTGNEIYVRETIGKMLLEVSSKLEKQYPNLSVEVVYGYRALEIQTKLFEKMQLELSSRFRGNDLLKATHQYIAVPDVAGHPTGGAVDVQILDKNRPMEFGTKIWEFVEDSMTFSPFISKEAWKNRQLLRYLMTSVGFAPFDGEWWHFSYGDKEWAKYFEKKHALYSIIPNFHIKNK